MGSPDESPATTDTDEFEALRQRLRAEGYQLEQALEYELMGHLPTGESFYFRARFRECLLWVYPQYREGPIGPVASTIPADYQDAVDGYLDGTPFEEFEASCLDAAEMEPIFRHLVARYLDD